MSDSSVFSNAPEYLRTLSLRRQKLVDAISSTSNDIPVIGHKLATYIDMPAVFHLLVITTTIFIVIAVFAKIRGITLFSIHPLCMTVGTIIFIAEGIVAYRSRALVETLAPIMQHSKRVKVRALHQTLQMVGSSFLGLGLLFIVAHKTEYKKSIMPKTIHSSIGIIAISLIIVQIVVGNQKITHLDRSNTKSQRWHGDCGLLVWDLLCITLITGLLEFLPFSFFTFIVVSLIVILWISTHSQMKRQNPDGAGGIGAIPFSASTNEVTGDNDDFEKEALNEATERTA
jgi:hypothetical protein